MISLIIPCYRESSGLNLTYQRITTAAKRWHQPYEVILVDDGSDDATWDAIVALNRRDARWKGLRLARNFGQQAAIGAGLDYANGDAVVVVDADLQDPPELIHDMIDKWQQGYEVVYGVRTDRPESWAKRLAYWAYYRLLRSATGSNVPCDAGDFALMDRRVVEVLRTMPEQAPYWRGLRYWTGFQQTGLPYRRRPRQVGTSRFTLVKLMQLAWDGWFALSRSALPGWAALGLVCVCGVTAIGGLILLGAEMTPTLVWLGTLFTALQILGLGLIGRFLVRIFDEVRRRPRWIIADAVGFTSLTTCKALEADRVQSGERAGEPSRLG